MMVLEPVMVPPSHQRFYLINRGYIMSSFHGLNISRTMEPWFLVRNASQFFQWDFRNLDPKRKMQKIFIRFRKTNHWTHRPTLNAAEASLSLTRPLSNGSNLSKKNNIKINSRNTLILLTLASRGYENSMKFVCWRSYLKKWRDICQNKK